MGIMIGSARHDEHGNCYHGGATGDQLQKSNKNDTVGEVSMQAFYIHKNGWYILRPKSVHHANAIAERMKAACNNKNIGYDQDGRLGIIKNGIDSKVKTEADCSSLVRQAVKEATGKDPGNFTTYDEATVLEKTGLFEKKIAYVSQEKTPIYDGDVLVSKVKGHTVAAVSGNPRKAKEASGNGCPYPKPEAVMKKGFKGSGVKWMQWHLNKLLAKGVISAKHNGKVITKLTVDGEWGDLTECVFLAFQKKYPATGSCNAPDGKCGPASRSKLKSLVK